MKIERAFYMRSGLTVARDLIGKQLVHMSPEGITKGIIVEVEAYIGPNDAAEYPWRFVLRDSPFLSVPPRS